MNLNELVQIKDDEETSVTNIYDYFSSQVQELVRIVFSREDAKYTKSYFQTYLSPKVSTPILPEHQNSFDHQFFQYHYTPALPSPTRQDIKLFKSKLRDGFILNIVRKKEFWLYVSKAYFKQIQYPSYYYASLRQIYSRQGSTQFSEIIECDLNRTKVFQDEELQGKSIVVMRRVLNCIVVRNPYIGYCQGFSYILAQLLQLGFLEEEAFWFFLTLLEDILPLDYYINLRGIRAVSHVIEMYLQIYQSEGLQNLKELDCDIHVFTTKWLIKLLCTSVARNMMSIVLNNLIIYKIHGLVKCTLALILRVFDHLPEITRIPDCMSIYQQVERFLSCLENPEQFQEDVNAIYFSKQLYDVLHFLVENNLRNDQMIVDVKRVMKHDRYFITKHQKTQHKCNPSFKICLSFLEISQQLNYQIFDQYQIFTGQKSFQIVDNYVDQCLKNKKGRIIFHKTTIPAALEEKNNILIARSKHICQESLVFEHHNSQPNPQTLQKFISKKLSRVQSEKQLSLTKKSSASFSHMHQDFTAKKRRIQIEQTEESLIRVNNMKFRSEKKEKRDSEDRQSQGLMNKLSSFFSYMITDDE